MGVESEELSVDEYMAQLQAHMRFIMPLMPAEHRQTATEIMQGRSERWNAFPADKSLMPEWFTLSPPKSLECWHDFMEHDMECSADLCRQWSQHAIEPSGIGYMEATKILEQMMVTWRSQNGFKSSASGYLHALLVESREFVHKCTSNGISSWDQAALDEQAAYLSSWHAAPVAPTATAAQAAAPIPRDEQAYYNQRHGTDSTWASWTPPWQHGWGAHSYGGGKGRWIDGSGGKGKGKDGWSGQSWGSNWPGY